MKTLEALKQFVFASALFVTAVTIHWNFMSDQAQQTYTKKVQKQQVEQIQLANEKLALHQASKTAQI